MKFNSLSLTIMLSLIITVSFLTTVPNVFAATWYPGEGLKQGDYYKYKICTADWHNCEPIEIDFWVQNQTSSGTNLMMVVTDGSIVQKGIVTIGLNSPDPIYSDSNLANYASMFKNSLAWLDAFATKITAKDLSSPAWGNTGIFGETTLGSVGQQQVTVPAGAFNAWDIQWHDSGATSDIWVYPPLAFPVKARVYAIVTSGVPPLSYSIDLLEHGNSKTPPSFLSVQSTSTAGGNINCPTPNMQQDAVHGTNSTNAGSTTIEYMYSPSIPHQGCPIEWRIWFEKSFDPSQKYFDSHYDIFTVDNQGNQLSSYAQSIGRVDMYAPVGSDDVTFLQHQPPPLTHYVIYFAGTGPESGVSDVSSAGSIQVDVKVASPFASPLSPTTNSSNASSQTSTNQSSTTSTTNSTQSIVIPAWIKNNAKWWSQGQIGDGQFVQGLQYMIQHGIIQIPTGSGSTATSGTQQIPAWIKNDAGWWASGQIGDGQFVQGLQYMITNGIIKINS